MRFLILAAAVLMAPAAAPAGEPNLLGKATGNMPVVNPNGPVNAKCPPVSYYYAMKRGNTRAVRNLAELPPAAHYKTAYRRIDGCEVPIIAGYGIGATGDGKPKR